MEAHDGLDEAEHGHDLADLEEHEELVHSGSK